MKRKMLFVFTLFALGALVLAACGSKGGGGDASGGSQKIGDAVEVKEQNLVITMDSGALNNNKIMATFTIENKGGSDFAIDPKTTFIISGSSGEENVPLTLDTLTCGSKMIKGPVPAGGKTTGNMCWRGDPTLTWPINVVISFGGAEGAPGVVTWKLAVEE
jgi:hypothetical protein